MLKKFAWIAALLAAFAIVFIGCPTELGKQDDGSQPRQAEDLVLEGEDIILKACGASQSKVVIDGTKVTLDGNNTGFYFDFPAEAATYGEVQVFFEIVEVMAGTGPGLLIKKNTQFHNPVGITSDQDPAYQLNNVGPAGTKFDTGVWKTNQFDNQMAFQNQVYNPANNSDSKFTVEVLKIVFPGGDPVAPPPPLPEYTGAAGKVVYTKTTAGVETVVDSDPSVLGNASMTISATGVASMATGAILHYKFPTSALEGTTAKAIDIESDWDYVEIEYTVSDVDKTSGGAGNFKARFYQYDSSTPYGYGSDPADMDSNGYANLGAAGTAKTYKIQTWGAGGKGGFTIGYNQYDVESTGADSLNFKITKVTFTKGDRYKVDFYSPQANFNTSVIVLDGNGIGTLPSVTVSGYTLFGWYTEWDKYGLVDLNTSNGTKTLRSSPSTLEAQFVNIIGTKVSGSTPITGDTKVYAYWFSDVLPPITITVGDGTTEGGSDADGTLFAAAGNYTDADPANASTTVTYGDKKWWVVADATRNSAAAFTSTLGEGEALPEGLTAAALAAAHKGAFTTRLAFEIPQEALIYDTVTITYDTIFISGDPGVVIRTNAGATSGSEASGLDNNYPYLGGEESKTNATFVWPVSSFVSGGYLAMAKNNPGLVLVRITKIEFTFD